MNEQNDGRRVQSRYLKHDMLGLGLSSLVLFGSGQSMST